MDTLINISQSLMRYVFYEPIFNSYPKLCITIVTSIIFFTIIGLFKVKRSSKLVPYPPYSAWETIKILATETPLRTFILEAANSNQWNFRLPVPYLNIFIVGDPQLQREILTDPKSQKSAAFYTGIRQVFRGSSPLFTRLHYDEYVKSMRKSTAHAFSSNQVRRMMTIAKDEFNQWLEKDVQELIDGKDDGIFDPCVEINRVTFYVICKAAFEYECTLDEYNEFTRNLEPALREYLLKQVLNPLRKPFGAFIPNVVKASEGAKGAMAFAQRVLESYRRLENKNSGTKSLASIIETNENLNSDMLRCGEVLQWLAAGHDTTGHSVASTFVLLAKYQDAQNRLRKELNEAKDNGDPSKSMHVNCSYLEYVWKESNRIMPVGSSPSVRAAGKDFYVKHNDDSGKERLIPKGSTVIISSTISNRNKIIFGEDTTIFRPERWEEAAKSDPERYKLMNQSLITFSIGNRSCPGKSLAMSEIYTFLPEFFLNYKVELIDEGVPESFLTQKYKGAKLKVSKA